MALFSRNIPLTGPLKLSPWRSMALLAWDSVSDASVHVVIEVEAGPMLRFIRRRGESTGIRIRPVHFVGKTLGATLRKYPDINCILRRGGLWRRRDVDIMFPVALDGRGYDMAAAVIRHVDRKPVEEVARELSQAVVDLRRQGESNFRVGTGILQRPLLRCLEFLLFTLNLWTPALGIPRDAFGGAAVTDVSSFGADFAFPPLLPIARLPLVIGVGAIFDRFGPDGKSVKWLRLFVVFDHRVIDGVYAGRLSRYLRRVFARPGDYYGDDESAGPAENPD